jgi:large subunit ribosomal protein L24
VQKIKRNDQVVVLAGKDQGKRGRVRQVLLRENRLIVEGAQMVKRHLRARPGVQQAGIVEREASIPVSRVALLCPHCQQPVRVGFQVSANGNKVRVCKKCHQTIE